MPFRVVATARSFCNTPGAHHDLLRAQDCVVDLRAQAHPLDAAALGALLPGCDGVILGLDECSAAALAQADSLRVISRYGVGVDAVDLQAAAQRGIAVTNTPGANSVGVAELAIALMFALARDLPNVAHAARTGQQKRGAGWELTGKTLGLVGFGAIGREVAQRALGLKMQVLAVDPFWRGTFEGVRRVEMPELLAESHIISLHTALTPETANLINAAALAQMRDGAVLINTARGGLVDEAALAEALAAGKLAGAAADALQDEAAATSPLLALENFIATPHLGATTRESVLRMALHAAENLVKILRGEPCEFVVNADLLAAGRGPTHPA